MNPRNVTITLLGAFATIAVASYSTASPWTLVVIPVLTVPLLAWAAVAFKRQCPGVDKSQLLLMVMGTFFAATSMSMSATGIAMRGFGSTGLILFVGSCLMIAGVAVLVGSFIRRESDSPRAPRMSGVIIDNDRTL